MLRKSKKPIKAIVYWPQSTSTERSSTEHDDFIQKLLIVLLRNGGKGLSEETQIRYRDACRWLIESLYQAHYSIPPAPIALPRSKDVYGSDSTYGMPFGHTITMKVFDAAILCQFISVKLGQYVSSGKGWVTRAWPAGRLLKHFIQLGYRWKSPLPPPVENLIYINEGVRGSLRRIASISDAKSVSGMRLRLNKINHFLSKQCIWIDLPNQALGAGFQQKVNSPTEQLRAEAKLQEEENPVVTISLANIHLRRIFTQNSLEKGGRFYGAWWQLVPSNLRRRIMINDDRTIELDYSGLALNMLYALGKVPLRGDPYDIGLQYTSKEDGRRRLVKRYVNAVLNDSSGKYQLSQEQLVELGLSHNELKSRIRDKHAPIAQHFNSGIGVTLQYYDSEMAERVITVLNAQGITCLPIHDSFIVPLRAHIILEMAMQATFREMFGVEIDIKETCGFLGTGLNGPRKALAKTVDSVESLIEAFTRHQQEYTFMTGYRESWRSANFSPSEVDLQLRSINIEHAIFKDRGLHSPYEHFFQGLYPLGRHL